MAKGKEKGDKVTGRLETGMLSFARSLQPSEGFFWGTRSSDPDYCEPIEVREKGVRGQSSEYKTDNPGKSNPQVVEAASVPPGCDGIRLDFTIWIAPFSRKPWACGDSQVAKEYEKLVDNYADKGGFEVLAELYLWNIANARFAWRNRFQSDDMRVEIGFDGRTVIFDPTRLDLEVPSSKDQFLAAALSNDPVPLEALRAWIARGLREDRTFCRVAWHAKMQEGQEVFPSQEYLRGDQVKLQKARKEGEIASRVYAKLPRISKGRSVEQASMHSQKIGAALRHIDIWHNHSDYKAIAINPYGGVQETGAVLRVDTKRGGKDSAKSFYVLREQVDELFDNINKAQTAKDLSGDVHFVVANLVRGGVFGQ